MSPAPRLRNLPAKKVMIWSLFTGLVKTMTMNRGEFWFPLHFPSLRCGSIIYRHRTSYFLTKKTLTKTMCTFLTFLCEDLWLSYKKQGSEWHLRTWSESGRRYLPLLWEGKASQDGVRAQAANQVAEISPNLCYWRQMNRNRVQRREEWRPLKLSFQLLLITPK
jgi:hypothetical protein